MVAPLTYEQEETENNVGQAVGGNILVEQSGHDDEVQPGKDHEDNAEPDDSALPSHSDLDLSSDPSGEQLKKLANGSAVFPVSF